MNSFQIAASVFLILNCLGYAIVLWHHTTGYQRANRYIASFLVMGSLSVVQDLFLDAPPQYSLWAYALFHPTLMVTAALAYFFFKTLTNSDTRVVPHFTNHLIPICLLHSLISYYVLSHPPTEPMGLVSTPDITTLERFYQFVNLIYLILSYRLIRRHKQVLQYFVSKDTAYDLLWIQKILIAIFFVWFSWTFIFIFNPIIGYFVHLTSVFYVFFVVIRQKALPSTLQVSYDAVEEIEQQNATETTPSKVLDPAIVSFKPLLLAYMTAQKPYLDPDISLPKLAEQMNVSVHFLSQTINTGLEENFFSFINRYRVEETKRLLHDPNKSHFNILQIAYEAGFNSKTTFNTAFKKITGYSPSAYQKQLAEV
jgi:AraC-like DNA-binding protein